MRRPQYLGGGFRSWRTAPAATRSTGLVGIDGETGPNAAHAAEGPRAGGGDAAGVLIATTTPALGAGLAAWIDQAPHPWRAAGVVDNAAGLPRKLVSGRLSLVVASVCLHGELVGAVTASSGAGVLLLVLAERLDAACEVDLLRGGADGVISSQINRDAFIQAVDTLLAGRSITSLAAMRELREARETAPALPPRMREVIELLAQGCGTAEIAERLSMSQGTVKTHIGRAASRLGLSGRNELVASARQILTEHPVSSGPTAGVIAQPNPE